MYSSGFLATLGLYASCLNNVGPVYQHVDFDKSNIKGKSAEEMGTAGNKKRSRKYRKNKRR